MMTETWWLWAFICVTLACAGASDLMRGIEGGGYFGFGCAFLCWLVVRLEGVRHRNMDGRPSSDS